MASSYDTWKLQSGEPEDDGFTGWQEGLGTEEMWYFAEDWMVQTKSLYGLVQRLDGTAEDMAARIRADLEQSFYSWLHEYYIKNVLPTLDEGPEYEDYPHANDAGMWD